MAKKSKRAKPAAIEAEVATCHLVKRIAELQHDMDAAKLRIDALEAARLDYSAPQQPLWWCFWKP